MAVPKYDDLMNPTLQALHILGGSASVSEIEETVAGLLELSEKDLNELHRGSSTKFNYRLAWSRNYLKRFGLVENSSRGVWALTAEGQKTRKIDKAIVKRSVKSLDTKNKQRKQSSDPVDSNNDLEEEWKNKLLEILKKIQPDSFERLCQRVLRESGFVQVEVTGKSGDGGIDGTGVVKIGGLLSFHVVFQCKRFRNSVSPKVVRDFRGAMIGRADKGLIITTGTFTSGARAEAMRDGAPPIDLIDGYALVEKLRELELGVDIVMHEQTNINAEWFESL